MKPFAAFILVIVLCFLFQSSLYSASLTAKALKDWNQDIGYLVSELPKNDPNIYEQISKNEFLKQVSILRKSFPRLANEDLPIEIAKLLAKAGDAHTFLPLDHAYAGLVPTNLNYHKFPLTLYWFSNDLCVTSTSKDYPFLLGLRLIKIENTDIIDVTNQVNSLISHENAARLKQWNPSYMTIPEVLKNLKIISSLDNARFTFRNSKNQIVQFIVKSKADNVRINWVDFHKPGIASPLYKKNNNLNYWCDYLADNRLLYFKYNKCFEISETPFNELTKNIFNYIDTKRVDKLVIDLRNNIGGDSYIIEDLIKGLNQRPSINKKGCIFVIIGRQTFSSGVTSAIELRKKTHAILIGEPADNYKFGNVKLLILPNSKLPLVYSTRKVPVLDKGMSIKPDINIELNLSEYYQGQDPIVNKILSF